MRKLLNSALWAIFLILTPITLVGAISQNSIPGDTLYPVKRSYENAALLAFSLFPERKANYSITVAENRYNEAQTLILVKSDTQGLDSLVSQVQSATKTIDNVKNEEQKEVLHEKLIASIDSYQQKLTQVQDQVAQAPTPTPQPPSSTNEQQPPQQSPGGTQNQKPQSVQKPILLSPTSIPPAQNQPETTQPPTIKTQTTTSPIQITISPPSSSVAVAPEQKREIKQSIEETQKKLDEIRKKIEEKREEIQQKQEEKREERESRKQEKEIGKSGIKIRSD